MGYKTTRLTIKLYCIHTEIYSLVNITRKINSSCYFTPENNKVFSQAEEITIGMVT